MDRPGGTVLVICKRGRCRAGHSTSVRYASGAGHPKMRRFSNLLILASIVLSLAAGAWWFRSRSTREGLYFHTGSWLWTVDSALGEFAVGNYRDAPAPSTPRLHYRAS